MSIDELIKIKQEHGELVAMQEEGLSLKVSTKGALSLYGMGRYPVTLYRTQWETVFRHRGVIERFIASHADTLAVKDASL